MNVQKADTQLVIRAAELARSSPRAWAEFLVEFQKYTARVRDQCVMSPVLELPVKQGIARGISATLELFEQCRENADKLAASADKQARNT